MTVIQHRRGTTAEWAASSYILEAGELGIEIDTSTTPDNVIGIKVGNGESLWAALDYVGSGDLSNINSLTFDTTPTSVPNTQGTMSWDSGEGTPSINLDPTNGVSLQIGQEQLVLCYNGTGSTIPKGSAVYISGAQGQRPSISLADADAESTSSKTLGITSQAIANGVEGFVNTFGIISGVDTSAFTAGSALWLSSTAGGITATKPSAPAHTVFIGYALHQNASSGRIFVNPQNGYEVDELHDVSITSLAAGHVLVRNTANTLWENKTLANAGIAALSGGNSLTGLQTLTPSSNSTSALRINSVSGMTANPLIMFDSGASQRFAVSEFGTTLIGSGTALAGRLGVHSGTATTIGAVIRGSASQSASLQEWQSSAGTVLAKVDASGNITAPTLTTTGNISVVGGGITTTSTGTATVFNTSASTVNIGGAASAVTLGSSTSITTVQNDLSVAGSLTVTGTITTQGTTNLVVEDPMIYLAEGNTANILDLGIIASFNNGTYQHSGIVRDATDGVWKVFSNVIPEPTGTVDFTSATYDILKVGSLQVTDATTTRSNLGLSTVASTGAYSDLSGKPTLATVATSGLYSDLSGKPSLATVATSGSYTDLLNKPTIDNTTYTFATGTTSGAFSVTPSGSTAQSISIYGWNDTNWNTAYGWGDHSLAGYLTTSLASSTYLAKTPTNLSNTEDLDALITPGYYYQALNANTDVSTRHYPVAQAGMLTVSAGGSMVFQTYQTYGTAGANRVYHRGKYNGAWSTWRNATDAADRYSGTAWTGSNTLMVASTAGASPPSARADGGALQAGDIWVSW